MHKYEIKETEKRKRKLGSEWKSFSGSQDCKAITTSTAPHYTILSTHPQYCLEFFETRSKKKKRLRMETKKGKATSDSVILCYLFNVCFAMLAGFFKIHYHFVQCWSCIREETTFLFIRTSLNTRVTLTA